ncbi:MAG: alpha/beta hydrolase [Gammaproteobacteria bacterium]
MTAFRPPAPERLLLEGPAGPLEAAFEVPADFDGQRIALVCHPHPLFGGTMDNKVVHTSARALQEAGYATLRFNFRGVGRSAGSWDHGRGEAEDAMAAAAALQARWPAAGLLVAGFSFGAYVATQLASRLPLRQLITIAPPVQRFDFSTLAIPTCPWLVLQGDQDELVDHEAVLAWTRTLEPAPTVVILSGAEHFFHGRLNDLRTALQEHLVP